MGNKQITEGSVTSVNIMVIGLGSMGKRRIRLIQKLRPDVSIVGVDTSEERRIDASSVLKLSCFASVKEALHSEGCSAAFVCTSPVTHATIISQCLEQGLHVFTEINLVADDYKKNMEMAQEKKCKLFLSSTFLYRKEVQHIIGRVHDDTGPLNYSYHVGQYLPDWHPWEDYRNYFVANPKTNGCRELFAIELPWLIAAFGSVVEIHAKKDKMSSLDLNYNDNYIVTLVHESGHKGVLLVDVVTRASQRSLDIWGESMQLSWRGSPETLQEFDLQEKTWRSLELYQAVNQDERYAKFIIENAYEAEISAFFEYVEMDCEPIYSFQQDLETLKMIDQIENPQQERRACP